ncbi:MAG: sugar phosphate isomerase/epimerase [Phycisphaerales bacterium]|nr:sugar phosphate isomerase/epimerase [Phycisphaerales bacterium]
MLLTLNANALRTRIATSKKARSGPDTLLVTDLPRFARDELGLFGLNLTTNLLVGADLARLDAMRDAADKASCPCLVLTESEVQPMGTTDDAIGDVAIARAQKVVQAAHRLGCNSIGLSISVKDNEDEIDFCVERLRRVLQLAERLEVNVLICPASGLTGDPERLTDLIKKVGGFRIGTFPDYEQAARSADPQLYLRRLTPYASAVTATTMRFRPGKRPGEFVHEPYDLAAYTGVVKAVGYTGTIAVDYRGDEDPVENLRRAVAMLEAIVGPVQLDAGLGEDELGLDEVEDVEDAESEGADDDGEEE